MPDTFSILKPPLARLLTGLVLPQFKICCQNWSSSSLPPTYSWSVEYAASYFKVKIFGQFTEMWLRGYKQFATVTISFSPSLNDNLHDRCQIIPNFLRRTIDTHTLTAYIKWKLVYFGQTNTDSHRCSCHTDSKFTESGVFVIASFARYTHTHWSTICAAAYLL